MKKELVEKYKDICAEIEQLKEDAAVVISDTVSGSADEYPFTKHSVTVRGVAEQPKIQRKIAELERQKEEVEHFVEAVESPRKRRLLWCVMKYGCRWNVVRRAMGEDKSADATRKEFERFFQ